MNTSDVLGGADAGIHDVGDHLLSPRAQPWGYVEWYRATGMRPHLDKLNKAQQEEFQRDVSAQLVQAYPARSAAARSSSASRACSSRPCGLARKGPKYE